jgi:hypothetical protein
MQAVVLSGLCNKDVAVERTWKYSQRPDKTTACILIAILS